VLDIDSERPDDFSVIDAHALEHLCEILQPLLG
jgi:putative methionine-R-sulfoxide reductase with GAF domain